MIRIGAAVSALAFGSVVFSGSQLALWAGYLLAAAGMGWVFPSVAALAANAVEPHEQGATAGTISVAHGRGMIAGPLVGPFVYALDPGAPYALFAGLLLLAALEPQRSRAGLAGQGG